MKQRSFDRNFVLMVIGQIISILGSSILRFALDLYVLDLTGRADIFALVMAISSIPFIAFSPIGGAIADRFNRRNLMVIFDFSSSAVILLLIALLFTGNANIVMITAVMFMLSLISAMYQPAVQASIPVLIKREGLTQANGIVSGVGALSGLMGPVLGGALYGLVGLNTLVEWSCVAFALSAIMEIFIRIPFERLPKTAGIVRTIAGDMKNGVQFLVRENPRMLKTIALAAGLNLFLSAFLIVGAPYVLRMTMHSSDMMYGVGMGLAQVAGIAGALLVGLFAKNMKLETLHRWVLAMAAMLLPMALAVTSGMLNLGYWPSFVLFFLFAMLIMMTATMLSIYVITEVQRETPNQLLGKVMAIVMAVAHCAMPVGQILYGALFEAFSAQVYVAVLIACALTALLGLATKRLLRLGAAPSALTVRAISRKPRAIAARYRSSRA